MRRPDGFERPLGQPAEDGAAHDEGGAQQGVAADVREVIRLDALRRRREEARRSAAEADWERSARPEPRRWSKLRELLCA